MFDISEESGYSISTQISLFNEITPLFKEKPVIIAFNKVDIIPFDSLTSEQQILFKNLQETNPRVINMIEISTLTGLGIDNVKIEVNYLSTIKQLNFSFQACESLNIYKGNLTRKQNREITADNLFITKVNLNPNHPPFPRPPKLNNNLGQTESQLEALSGGPGVYSFNERKKYCLDNQNWNYDVIPEFYMGKNIKDYIDENLSVNLKQIEEEETKKSTNIKPSKSWINLRKNVNRIFGRIKVMRSLSKLRKRPRILSRSVSYIGIKQFLFNNKCIKIIKIC